MATHSSILAWRIPQTEELGGLSPGGSQRVDTTAVTQHAWRDIYGALDRLMNLPRVTHVHAKMGTVKDRNGMVLTEAEDIKRWQEYTEGLYKKGLHNQITTMV